MGSLNAVLSTPRTLDTQDGGEISVRYLDVIGIARRLASMLGRCNNDDRKLGVSMLDRLPHAAHLAVCEDQRCPHSHLPL